MQSCVFCKIIAKQIPATIIAENESLIVIKDINPKAPIHYLIIPKIHKNNLNDFELEDKQLAAALLLMAKELGKQVPDNAYRLVMNNGSQAGQIVFHAHLHFLAQNASESDIAF